jgi:Uncharacterized protein conserved in bacteria
MRPEREQQIDMKIYFFGTSIGRKQGGSSRMIEISKREHFYQQEYCGCVFSLRDTNKWRRKNNKDRIIRGIKFY